jgi:hypothetical protein
MIRAAERLCFRLPPFFFLSIIAFWLIFIIFADYFLFFLRFSRCMIFQLSISPADSYFL